MTAWEHSPLGGLDDTSQSSPGKVCSLWGELILTAADGLAHGGSDHPRVRCLSEGTTGTHNFPVLTKTPRHEQIFMGNGLTAGPCVDPSKSLELGFRWALILFHQFHFTGNIFY